MDEMALVRAVLAPPPPPSPQITAQAWQRLLDLPSGGAPRRHPAGGPQRSPRRRWTLALTGVVTASLAGALAVTALLPGGVSGNGRGGLVTSERGYAIPSGRPAQAFLTAVATRIAQVKSGTGRYWCQSMTSGQLDPIGPRGRELTPAGQGETPSPASDYRYSVFSRSLQEDCFAYVGANTHNVGGYYQDLGARPASARDTAVWRRDGSPAWHAWYGGGQLIPARPGPRVPTSGKRGEMPWGSGTSLPAQPGKLRRVLMTGFPGPNDAGVRQEEHQTGLTYSQLRDENLWSRALGLLQDPLSPAVRAAAYQVMAGVPGVHMRPGATDPSGRTGTAMWLGASPAAGYSIIDPRTGVLLATLSLATGPHGVYAPGTLLEYSLWGAPHWASRPPR